MALDTGIIISIVYGGASCIVFAGVIIKAWRVMMKEFKFEPSNMDQFKPSNIELDMVNALSTSGTKSLSPRLDDDAKSDNNSNPNKNENNNQPKSKSCRKMCTHWLHIIYHLKSVYLAGVVHIYDIATDIGVIVDWFFLWRIQENEDSGYKELIHLSMLSMFIDAIVVFWLYRIISSLLILKYTRSYWKAFLQIFDLELYRVIYINHKLNINKPGFLQRWLSKLEATFESAPQSILQLVFLVKSQDIEFVDLSTNTLVIASLMFSLFSVSSRFLHDDELFFDKENAHSFIYSGKNDKNKTKYQFKIGCLVRYCWRFCDIIGRMLVLSLVWIVLGGRTLAIVVGVELSLIIIIIKVRKDVGFIYLQFAFATYLGGKDLENGFSTYSPIMKFSFIYRVAANFILLLIITIYLYSIHLDISFIDSPIFYCEFCSTQAYTNIIGGGYSSFGFVLFSISWGCVIFMPIFFSIISCNSKKWLIKKKELFISPDRDIAKCAYGIEREDWEKGAFDANVERDLLKVAFRGDFTSVKEMLEFGYNPKQIDENGRTVLHHACFNQDTTLDCLDFMINRGCSEIINVAEQIHGQVPLHYYVWANKHLKDDGHLQIKKFINDFNAKYEIHDKINNSLLHFACRNRHISAETIGLIVKEYKCTMNDQNDNGVTPFMLYLKWNKNAKKELFEEFIQTYHANVQIVDNNKNTTLHWGCSNWKGKQSPAMVQFLIENGCRNQINVRNNDDKLPKHMMDGIDDLDEKVKEEICDILDEASN